ncbi:hypothetical protein ACFQ9X_52995 [Catenulispora yoronensis]
MTRLRFTFFGEDGVIALPYWYDGPVARMAATMAFRFARAVEGETGLAAYDPQQRMPLAEMGLEKFIAGYLRGRERALEQARARGPVPVGRELPTGRSATRRELAAGPSAGVPASPPRKELEAGRRDRDRDRNRDRDRDRDRDRGLTPEARAALPPGKPRKPREPGGPRELPKGRR